jgi:hypothetical protein
MPNSAIRTICLSALASVLILALDVSVASAASVAKGSRTPAHPDLTGIWIGYYAGEAPQQYRNSSFPFPAPFTAEGRKQSAHWADPLNNQGAQCLPGGGPAGSMNGGSFFPIEIIQREEQVTLLLELMQQVRRVFTDGRSHPTADDLEQSWMGHSIGHWDGDALVIDTIGVHSGALNGSGAAVIVAATDKDPRMPYDENLHLVERLRLLEGGKVLEDVQTITDPSLYTQPFTLKRYWTRTDTPMVEYVCTENRRPLDEGIVPAPVSRN